MVRTLMASVALMAVAVPARGQAVVEEGEPIQLAAADIQNSADILVTGRLEREASIGKVDAPIKETPATINVVDRELLDLRQPRNFVEALRGVPGITQRSGRITTQNNLSRGFSLRQSGSELRNGLRHYESSNLAPELTNTERFEILKGPGSVLYGTGGLGGLFNVVTKRADTSDAFAVAEAAAGSFGFYRAAIDLNMPISTDGVWATRLNAHRERTGAQQDFVDQDTLLIAPTLSWRPSGDTSLVLDAEFLRGNFSPNLLGVPADGSVFFNPTVSVPKNRAVGDRFYNAILREQVYLGYSFDHRFSDAVSFHQGLLYAFSEKNQSRGTDPTGFVGGFTGPRRFLTRNASLGDTNWKSIAVDNNISFKFATGPARHELLVGLDYFRSNAAFENRTAPIAPFDLVTLNYFEQPTGPFVLTASSRAISEFAGLYVQETLIPVEQLRIVLAGRFTFADTENRNRLNQALSRRTKDEPFTPRVGIVWTPIEPISLFASYAESFNPLTGLSFAGEPFQPETGRSYEGGVKFALFNKRVDATIAAFDMKRANVLTADVANPGFSIQTGEQTSKGVEAEINGDVLPGWRITASYAFLDTKVSRDNTLLVGQPLQGTPRHAASLFTDYQFQAGPLAGFSVNGAIYYESQKWGQLVTPANSAITAFYVPGYTRVDAGVTLRWCRFSGQDAKLIPT